VDAGIILAIVIGSSLLGFYQEYRASAAVEELKKRLALHWERLRETAAAKIRIRTRGLPPCLQSRRSGPRRCASSTLFRPTTASRSAARAAVSPFGPEPSDVLTSPTSRLQYGAVVSGALTRLYFPGRPDSAVTFGV
jgi:hypothetical protein